MGVLVEIDETYETTRFVPVDSSERAFHEGWLQETLRRNPDVLALEEFGPIFHPLVPIGREVPTTAGSIDNLFISHAGYLVLVETKLWRNPEARREAVAQILDYALALARFSYDELEALTRDYVRRYEGTSCDSLQEWVEARLEPVDVGFQSRVARNLRLGRFLLLIVTDQQRPTVVDMLKGLSARAWLSVDIGVVELRPFRRTGDASRRLLLVPQVAGRTEIVERSVVEVTIAGAPGADIAVRKERRTDAEVPGGRAPLTSEVAFWELMRDRAPQAEEPSRRLLDGLRNERLELGLREASIVVEVLAPGDVPLPLFFLRSNGKVAFWAGVFGRRVREAGLGEDLAQRYIDRMGALLGASKGGRDVREVDIKAIQESALSFVRDVASAS